MISIQFGFNRYTSMKFPIKIFERFSLLFSNSSFDSEGIILVDTHPLKNIMITMDIIGLTQKIKKFLSNL